MDEIGFKKQKYLFMRFQECFPQIWISIFLIFIILILLILKLKKVLGNLDKITKRLISLASFQFGYLKGARFKYRLYFLSFCVQRRF